MGVWQDRCQDFAARGAKKHKGGGTFFKYNIGCMQQPGAKHEMGASDTTGPPLATTLECGQIHRCLFR